MASSYLGVHAINIYVRDQEESLRFYVDRLGFRVAFDARLQSGERWLAVAPPEGTAVLALIAPKPESRDFALIGRATGVVLLTEDVVAKYGEWRGRGVRFQYSPRLRRVDYERVGVTTKQNRLWGGVFTSFRDPDGNSFSLVGFDEVTRQIEERRNQEAAKIESERRAAQELEIAKDVQARFFPQELPPLRTLEYAGTCIQARQVGGDYYDFLKMGGERFGIVIGDIAGKGIAAALLMASLQANLRIQCALAQDQLRPLLQSVNQVFHQNSIASAYATLFFGEYDDESRLLRYANCGHLPGLLMRNDGRLERLDSTGTVLGLFGEWDCEIGEREIFAGDMLAVYTDGVTESFDEAGREFGEERLVAALLRHRELSAEGMVAGIVDEVKRFGAREQYDDITVTVAKCR